MEQNYRTLPDLVRHFGKDSSVQIHFQPFVGKEGDIFWVRDMKTLRAVFDEILTLRAEGHRKSNKCRFPTTCAQFLS
jgi:hypothetical protein